MNVRQVIPRDAIPSVDDPTFEATYNGADDDLLIVVERDEPSEPSRAYPIRFLNYHEIVNDEIDGIPLAVTWCPLCGSGVVYDRQHRGQTLEFGVSGKLAGDDLVMYDRQTESEWKQSTGTCIAGVFEGDSLPVRSSTVLSWARFRETYPDGGVLQAPGGASEAASDDETPAAIEYDQGPYQDYFDGDGFGLAAHRGADTRPWPRTDDIDPKTVVLGVERGEDALGFPLPRVRDAGGVVQTTVGDLAVVVFATTAGIFAYVDPGYAFERSGEAFDADDTTWDPATGRAADGRTLDRVPTRRLFAFTWQDDHGPAAFFDPR